MGTPGKLTRANLNFSIPSDGPLYPRLPYEYPGATLVMFEYETDPESASTLLPAQARLTDTPSAGLVFANYPAGTLGPYREVVLYLKALYTPPGATKESEVFYAAHLYVTTDTAMAAGREIAGFPKKIGEITFDEHEANISAFLDRPKGQRLASAEFTKAGDPIEAPPAVFTYLTLRLFPSPSQNADPSLCELLLTDWSMSNARLWTGQGTCALSASTSPNDPLNLVPILKITSARMIQGHMQVAANTLDRSAPF